MKVLCSVAGQQATVDNGRWLCADAELRSILQSLTDDNSDVWSRPENGEPDYAAAKYCMAELGGEIVDMEDLPGDGKVY